jgi:mercuric ion binding protein
MKKLFLALLVMSTIAVTAKTVTQKFMVKGQCGECKERIEKALDIPGVSFAEWNKDSKMLTVRFNDRKVSEDDLHTLISNLGYATSKLPANKDSQAKLSKMLPAQRSEVLF